jgi:hypothetical protein
MGLFGNNNQNGQSLMPTGMGGGPSNQQQQLLGQAAQDSGLASMGMQMADQMTGGQGMQNEDQVELLYRLMAAHPNQVVLFFLHYPDFMKEFAALIGLIFKKEMYSFFNSGMIMTPTNRGDPLTVNAGVAVDYSSITAENIETQIGKILPMHQMQAEVSSSDMQAMQMMGGHQQQQMQNQNQYQQQQMQNQYQQQMYQQPVQPQKQGFGAAVAGFGSNIIRGSLGLPPAQQQSQMGTQQPQMGMQQPQMGMQQPQMGMQPGIRQF